MSINLALLILSSIASCLLIFQLKNFWNRVQSYTWKNAFGEITHFESSKIETESGNFFNEKIELQYQVNGENYKKEWQSLEPCSFFPTQVVSLFSQPKTVEVFYHPQNPELAVLKKGLCSKMWVSFIGLVFFMMVGIWSFCEMFVFAA